jgi:hypothetical protein
MTYDLNLNNLVVPAASSFNIQVNSANRAVNSVVISDNKVQLTLASAIKFGDVIKVTYTKPSTNPLQTATGAKATSISAQLVTNHLSAPTASGTAANITMSVTPNPVHRMINILFTYAITFSKQDPAASPQIVRILDISGNIFIEKLLDIGVASIRFPINLKSGIYTVMLLSGSQAISSKEIIVYR